MCCVPNRVTQKHIATPFVTIHCSVRVQRCCIQVSDCCAVAHVSINVHIWLEWFCCLVSALLSSYFRLKYPNHKICTPWCRSLEFLGLLCRISSVGEQGGWTVCFALLLSPTRACCMGRRKLSLQSLSILLFHFYFSWVLFLRRKGKKKKGRGERVLEKQRMGANWPSVCFVTVLRSPIRMAHTAFGEGGELNVLP